MNLEKFRCILDPEFGQDVKFTTLGGFWKDKDKDFKWTNAGTKEKVWTALVANFINPGDDWDTHKSNMYGMFFNTKVKHCRHFEQIWAWLNATDHKHYLEDHNIHALLQRTGLFSWSTRWDKTVNAELGDKQAFADLLFNASYVQSTRFIPKSSITFQQIGTKAKNEYVVRVNKLDHCTIVAAIKHINDHSKVHIDYTVDIMDNKRQYVYFVMKLRPKFIEADDAKGAYEFWSGLNSSIKDRSNAVELELARLDAEIKVLTKKRGAYAHELSQIKNMVIPYA